MSDEAITGQIQEIEVNGMKIEVGEPPFDVEADFELLLGDDASNTAWLRKQYPYLWLRTIDGEQVWPINHLSEYKVVRRRLGNEGYIQLLKAIENLTKGQLDKVKNSPRTPNSGDAADS